MNVNEGITVEGQPGTDAGVNSQEGWDAALRAKVAAAREPEAAPAEERSAPVAPDNDDAAAIKRQLLSDEGSTTIKDGLSSPATDADKWGHTASERARIHEEFERSLRANGIDPDEPVAPTPVSPDSIELAQLREEKAVSDFWDNIVQGGDAEIATNLARLQQTVGPDVVEEVLWEALGIDEHTPEDSHLWDELDMLEEAAAQVAAQVEFQASAQLANAMREHVSQQTLRELKTTLNGWARSEGLSGAQARARISQVEQFMGHDLAQVAQEFGVARAEDILRAGDALIDEGAHAERVARFKESFLAEASTSVSEGLTINAGMGDVPLVPRPQIGTQIDPERVARKATSRGRTTSRDIRRGVAQTDRIQAGMDEMRKLATKLAGEQMPKPRTPAGF